MYAWIKPLLFRMDPERAHHMTLSMLSKAPAIVSMLAPSISPASSLSQEFFGLQFPHPIGLAAGLDKDGVALTGLFQCGFSFVEVGTVTPRPQPGNPKPRLFRLIPDEALINRMGFNNGGSDALRTRLQSVSRRGVIGVNLGKNKITPNEQAIDDYLQSLTDLYDVADYFVINVSSPNTPGLRDLQAADQLLPLAKAVIHQRNELSAKHASNHRPPVLVKVAPDLSDDALKLIGESLSEHVEGLIATNTTIGRPNLQDAKQAETGGLSGKPLRQRSTDVVRILRMSTEGRIPIIGCGGVFSAADAYEKIRAGADLVQIYTSLIYRGPAVVHEIVNGLTTLLKQDGFSSIAEAVGIDATQNFRR